MKKDVRSSGLLFVIILLLAGALICFLAASDLVGAEAKGQEITVTGVNYCFGCDLKKAHGAGAQCAIFGHKHALKVTKIEDSAGKAITGHEGKTLHYLLTTESGPLWNGEKTHEKNVNIKGLLYSDERVIEVKSYNVVE